MLRHILHLRSAQVRSGRSVTDSQTQVSSRGETQRDLEDSGAGITKESGRHRQTVGGRGSCGHPQRKQNCRESARWVEEQHTTCRVLHVVVLLSCPRFGKNHQRQSETLLSTLFCVFLVAACSGVPCSSWNAHAFPSCQHVCTLSCHGLADLTPLSPALQVLRPVAPVPVVVASRIFLITWTSNLGSESGASPVPVSSLVLTLPCLLPLGLSPPPPLVLHACPLLLGACCGQAGLQARRGLH